MEQFTFLLLIATYCQYYRDPDRLCVAFPLDISLIVGSQGLIQIQEPSFHSGFPIFSLRTSLHYQTIVRTRRPKRLTNGLQAKPSHFLLCKWSFIGMQPLPFISTFFGGSFLTVRAELRSVTEAIWPAKSRLLSCPLQKTLLALIYVDFSYWFLPQCKLKLRETYKHTSISHHSWWSCSLGNHCTVMRTWE